MVVADGIRQLSNMPQDELMARAKELGAPFELVEEVRRIGKLPVVNFAAGGVATPADAALMMRLGASSIFVGSAIFTTTDSAKRAKAIVQAATYYQDDGKILEAMKGLSEAMTGIEMRMLAKEELLSLRGN